MLVKHCNVCTAIVHIKVFILNKVTYCVVNLLSLRITFYVRKLLYTLQDVVVKGKAKFKL